MKKILMFDTSYGTQNLGDYIIMESINKEMKYIFEDNFVIRYSTHTPIARWYQNFRKNITIKACESSEYKFLGGTNLIKYSLLRIAPDFNINYFNIKYYKDSICIGCGSGANAKHMDIYTKCIYKKIFSKKYIHSTRDEKTKKLLESLGFRAINTGCPTLWDFTKEFCETIPSKKADNVVFTLTDYRKNKEVDQQLINTLLKNYKKIYFWGQGSGDVEYLQELDNIEKIKIVGPNLESYKKVLESKNIDYVGTRLHGGIYAMKHRVRSIIIAIDNRAKDMAETYNINTLNKEEINKLDSFINSEFNTNINIDQEKINLWKSQFIK